MGTGAKVAIGCGIFIVLAGIATVVSVVGGAYWLKGKADGFVADKQAQEAKIEDLEKKADANAYTAPADGVIHEDRLVKFLDVRKQVHATYEKYRADLEGLDKAGKKKEADFNDLKKGLGALAALNDLRLAQAQALADQGMSREEYRDLVGAIYKTAWASEVQASNNGRTMSQVTEDSMKETARALEQQARETPDPKLPPEAQRAWREGQEQARQAQEKLKDETSEAVRNAQSLDVPPQNVTLFKKYEADIKKYAMTGLEVIGL
jgi:hypothetical protein